jgi:hypothetical protein
MGTETRIVQPNRCELAAGAIGFRNDLTLRCRHQGQRAILARIHQHPSAARLRLLQERRSA